MTKRIAAYSAMGLLASVLVTTAQAQTPPAQVPATAAPVEQTTAPSVQPAPKVLDAAPAKVDAGAPLEGANSFTEAQAKQRAADAGYTAVSTLVKDDRGVWRGTAMKAGKSASIAVDYKGNVVQFN